MKPFSEPSERNRAPILAILKRVFRDRKKVLEVGSGTGQHAAYFAPELPHLVWQASDVAENLPGIRQWVSDPPPIELDVDRPWPALDADLEPDDPPDDRLRLVQRTRRRWLAAL